MRNLERIYPWFLGAPIILPLVIWGSLIYPYLVPKTLFFYALTFLSVGIFVILIAYNRPFYWSRLSHRITWIPLILLALSYLASIFGLGFYHSFWSVFVRGDGLLMLTCAVASFYMLLVYVDRDYFTRLIRAIAFMGSFIAVYGIGEWFLGGAGRTGGLLGNAAFFAGYLGITFFATLIAARTHTLFWKRAAHVGAALQIIAILLSATRGTIVALCVALIAWLVYGAIHKNGDYRKRSAIALGSFIVLGGFFFAFRSDLTNVPITPIARLASISNKDPDVASRLFIWKNMVGEIAQHPFLGVGAEHIDALFNQFYDPTQIQEQWFDRSHNAFLDYAAQYGIGGLLLYLALIASFFVAARRFFQRGERATALLISLLALTYAVQNFFVFDTVSSFWLFLALLALSLGVSFNGESPRTTLALSRSSRTIFVLGALILVLLIIPVSIRPVRAAYDLMQAYKYQLTDVARETSYLSHGFALGTYGDIEYGYEAYDIYVNNQTTTLTGNNLVNGYQTALSILTQDFNRYPYDARTALYLVGVLNSAPPGMSVDTSLERTAAARAIALSPKRYQTWYALVNLSIGEANTYPIGSAERKNGYQQAISTLKAYELLVPSLSEPHFVLAQLDYAIADTSAAAKEAALGKATYTSDIETARRAVSFYESVKDLTDLKFFLGEVVRLSPGDNAARYELAQVIYLTGNPAGAATIVDALRQSDPNILSTNPQFLNIITTYEQSIH